MESNDQNLIQGKGIKAQLLGIDVYYDLVSIENHSFIE
jgi:hypothetical protein